MRALLLAAALLCLGAAPAHAQTDPSFGGAGWVRAAGLPGQIALSAATGVAVQPDGRIVATAAGTDAYGDPGWYVLRFLPGGTLDPAFGQAGAVDLGSHGTAEAVALAPDGRIVVAGTSLCPGLQRCFAAARLNADGSRDAAFGLARVPLSQPTAGAAVAVQADGGIVVAGSYYKGGDANDDDVGLVARLLPDGRPDPAFSRDGVVLVEHGHGDDVIEAVALQGRRIVVAGAGRSIGSSRGGFGVARLRPDGALDRRFGRRGRRVVAVGGGWAVAQALAVTRGGRLVVAGSAGTGLDWRPAVARLRAGGSLDRSFGRRGRVVVRGLPFGGGAEGVQIDPRGRVLVAGEAFADAAHDLSEWLLVRLSRRGRGAGGLVRGDYSAGSDRGTALALDGGHVVGAGEIGGAAGIARWVLP
jgi:uncharacterized delta-60 repeat protein